MKKVFAKIVLISLICFNFACKNDMEDESNVPVYNVLMVYVDEIQATFPTGSISHKMTANEKQICEMATAKMSKWYNDAFNGSVKFKIDAYYTQSVVNETHFRDMGGGFALFYNNIPELQEISKKYRAVGITYSAGYTGGHSVLWLPCASGNAMQIYLQYRLFADTPVSQLDDDWWEETLYLYLHEMMHIFELETGAFDYHYALNMGGENQLHGVPFGHKRLNLINKLYLLNDLDIITEQGVQKVGVVFDYWRGDKRFAKVDYYYYYLCEIQGTVYSELITVDRQYQAVIGAKLKEPKSPVRAGYRFDGWFRDINDDLFKNKWNFSADNLEGYVSLFAKMTLVDPNAAKVAVFFDTMAEFQIPAMLELEKGSKIIAPLVPTRFGFEFDGWFKEVSLVNPWNWDTDTVTENAMLFAKWVEFINNEPDKK